MQSICILTSEWIYIYFMILQTSKTKDFNDHNVLTIYGIQIQFARYMVSHVISVRQTPMQAHPIQHKSAKLGWGCTTPNFARFVIWRRGIEIQPPGSA